MDKDVEVGETSFSLPSPTDTPYNRTPSSSRSRRSHTLGSVSPSSSPPPLPMEEKPVPRRSRDSVDPATDESISPLDPRRFTPTLHASLVSEILSLRRDLEDRVKDIDHLEINLHATREENDTLSERLAVTAKESRALKRQMQHLESGTLSAVDELAKERDSAHNDVADLRKRLEQSQRRARSHEENAERTQALWDRDRLAWEADRRTLETKVHVVEGRLKIVLNEVANSHFSHTNGANGDSNHDERISILESPSKRQNFAFAHRRRQSTASDKSDGRASKLSNHVPNGHSTSLADELAFEEEDEDHLADVHEHDGYSSADALPEEHERPMSSMSRRSQKAYKILGLPLDLEGSEIADIREPVRSPTKAMASIAEKPSLPDIGKSPVQYVDSAVQYDLRPLPEPVIETPVLQQPVMVSTSSQTDEIHDEVPAAVVDLDKSIDPAIIDTPKPVEMSSVSTQTDTIAPKPVAPTSWHQLTTQDIPTIAIIPPSSRPATPTGEAVLPPRTKNASCQAEMPAFVGYVSTEMQTEEIRVDRRPIEIPPHLLPSAKLDSSSLFKKPAAIVSPIALPNSSRRRFHQAPAPAPQVPPPAVPGSVRAARDSIMDRTPYPPGNDSGPLTDDEDLPVTRPVRSSSLFAGFDEQSDDEYSKVFEEQMGDDDIFQRPTMKFTLRSGKLVSQDPVLEEEDSEVFAAEAGEALAIEKLRLSEDSIDGSRRMAGRRSPPRKAAQTTASNLKQLRRIPSVKQNNFRRTALVSSGVAAHSSSQRPSIDSQFSRSDPPPIPVPTRFSSRKVPKSASEGARSTTPTSGMSPTKRRTAKVNKFDLRKSRSAINIAPANNHQRRGSRSPPLNPRISIVPDIPSFPPLPFDHASASRPKHTSNGVRPPPVESRKPSLSKTPSVESVDQSTSVVDAIAQTMVGEWMYKYVRRRKSFGIPESKPSGYDPTKNADEINQNLTSTGIRHKRWVWVAPYERAIMWSSKQPTSESALLGKSGRKLTVQSVLDVKDDNPMPKGAAPASQFNRSILVLTPERALKFTAMTRERHYVWLTALSFLSHSPLSFGDLAALPPPPLVEAKPPTPQLAGSLRKRTIRDSILMTKGSGRAGPRSFTADAILQPVPNYDTANQIDDNDPISDAAFPPSVPRFSHQHTRKRSNTAPRAPPSSFRSFSQKDSVSLPRQSATYSHSVTTTAGASSERAYTPSLGMQSIYDGSRRGSEASFTAPTSGRPNAQQGHAYSDFTGLASTMKMEAFIDNKFGTGKQKGSYRTKQGWKKDIGPYWGVEGADDFLPPDMTIDELGFESSRVEDPFRGF